MGNTVFADTNIVEKPDAVKVFVGATPQENTLSRMSFSAERMSAINEKNQNAPEKTNVAVISFDRYMTAKEVESVVAEIADCNVKEIFWGIPGVDGRAVIGKTGDGTITERVNTNFSEMLESEKNPEMQQEILSYWNNAEIFAITVETTNNEIAKASKMDSVNFIDTYDYPEAEKIAERRNVSVSYISVPEKPDDAK